MKPSRLVLGCLLTCLAITALLRPATADRLADVKQRGKLVVGASDAIPPFTFRRSGEIVGYDADLVHGIADRIGVKAEFITVPESARIRAIGDGTIDLIASTFTRTPEREREVAFSFNIFYSPQVVLVDQSAGFRTIRDLAGKTFGVLKGRTSDKNILEVLPDARFVYLEEYAVAFESLRKRTLDAFIADNLVMRTNLKKESDRDRFFFIPDFKKDREAGFGLPRGEPALKSAVDGALLDMERAGQAAKVFDTWFGPNSDVPIDRTFTIGPDR
jgi:polar amino acid transport system substrate-binding protein